MHYEKNYLTAVVLRVDFEPVAAFKASERPPLSNRIEARFPKVTAKPMAQVSFNIGPTGTAINQELLGNTYEHRKTDEPLPAATLSSEFLSIDYGNSYQHFEAFADDVSHVYGALAELYPDLVVKRVGLRYVNEIALPQGNALDWTNLIRNELVASVKAALPVDMKLARSMHQLQAFNDEASVLLHYGLTNPDYPGELVRRHFVLDIDAFKLGPMNTGQILGVAKALNKVCEHTFENSIEDGLRNLMGVINDAA